MNKIDKPQARLTKKKREKSQIASVRNETGAITTDLADIKRILREDYENSSDINLTN